MVKNLKEKLFRNQHDKTNTKMGGICFMDNFWLYGSLLEYCTIQNNVVYFTLKLYIYTPIPTGGQFLEIKQKHYFI